MHVKICIYFPKIKVVKPLRDDDETRLAALVTKKERATRMNVNEAVKCPY